MDEQGAVVRSPRLAQRRRDVRGIRRRRRVRTAIVAAGLAGAGVGAWFLNGSSMFAIQSVEVVGAKRIDPTVVIDASGLREGTSALAADLERAAARVRSLPGVGEVIVERDGSLGVRIVIAELTPAFVLRAAGSSWVVDGRGSLVQPGTAEGLPVIDAPNGVLERGEPSLEPALAEGFGALWAALRERGRTVDSFTLGADGRVSFRWGRIEVAFGELSEVEDKLEAVALVRAQTRGRIERIDVTSPARPAVTMA